MNIDRMWELGKKTVVELEKKNVRGNDWEEDRRGKEQEKWKMSSFKTVSRGNRQTSQS